jgi:diacylglycerol kinase (ATP)
MKKMLFIYNPNAGTGVLKPKLSDVLDIFGENVFNDTVMQERLPKKVCQS